MKLPRPELAIDILSPTEVEDVQMSQADYEKSVEIYSSMKIADQKIAARFIEDDILLNELESRIKILREQLSNVRKALAIDECK